MHIHIFNLCKEEMMGNMNTTDYVYVHVIYIERQYTHDQIDKHINRYINK